MCGHALVGTVHDRLNHTDWQLDVVIEQNNRLAETQTALLEASIQLVEAAGLRRYEVAVEEAGYELENPEVGLMAFLYTFLPQRRALDVGAHVGDVSQGMLEAGYEVYAFEPNPAAYTRLVERLGERAGFRAFDCALGAEEATLPLFVAEDRSPDARYGEATAYASLVQHAMPPELTFTGQVPVRVRTLEALHAEGAVPADVGLAKIDTEGFDLDVIRGMGQHRYPVVCAEFWDRGIPFAASGLRYELSDLVREMRGRGYGWHTVIYRIWGRPGIAFYSNHPRSVAASWGNVFFFRDFTVFREADQWCAAMLARTYFRPAKPGPASGGKRNS
jgi:FkbM family methyltransferase